MMMTRAEALRKCLIVFDALKRVSSKGNAGLEALDGAKESFRTDSEICQVLREWLREMEAGTVTNIPMEPKPYSLERMLKGNPLMMTEEVLAAARRVDEARDRMIEKYADRGLAVPCGPLEQKVGELKDYDKVTRIADWQREVMENGLDEELRLR